MDGYCKPDPQKWLDSFQGVTNFSRNAEAPATRRTEQHRGHTGAAPTPGHWGGCQALQRATLGGTRPRTGLKDQHLLPLEIHQVPQSTEGNSKAHENVHAGAACTALWLSCAHPPAPTWIKEGPIWERGKHLGFLWSQLENAAWHTRNSGTWCNLSSFSENKIHPSDGFAALIKVVFRNDNWH